MMARFPTWALGYADEMSVRSGESVSFRISGSGTPAVETQLVRLIHGDTNPAGPGFREVEIESNLDSEYPLVDQESHYGSYARLGRARSVLPDSGRACSLFVMVRASRSEHEQAVMSAWDQATDQGFALLLDAEGRPAFRLGSERGACDVTLPDPLLMGVWYALCAGWTPEDGEIYLGATPVLNAYNGRFSPMTAPPSAAARSRTSGPTSWPDVDVLVGALDTSDGGIVRGRFNGRVSLPSIYARPLKDEALATLSRSGAFPAHDDGLLAWWDLSQGISGLSVAGRGERGTDGSLINAPTRGVTAHNWDGSCYEWPHAPSLYGAVHFHEDDIDDIGWATTCSIRLDDALRSGLYALRLRADRFESHVPFAVRARPGRESRVCLVLPTASYMAYANIRDQTAALSEVAAGRTPILQPMDLFLMEHPELGLSLYDCHTDGSGVSLTSRRRPIVNTAPHHRYHLMGTWQLPSDLYIIDWLEQRQHGYDVLTDEDLDRNGDSALRPYRAVMTGTHPEYTSERMLDAYESYVSGGGHVMYMGGNGFYWVVCYHPERPWLLEVRRGENGVRAWQVEPGEAHHSTTGEKGGLWRNRGRAPQKVFTTGFSSEGYGGAFPYRAMSDSELPEVDWLFAGVKKRNCIGDFGLVGGGAAGQELDRADLDLGTPLGTYLLAVAEGMNDLYKSVPEDISVITDGLGGTESPTVRADLTYYEAPGGGAVFATSSIAWAGSLSHANYDNDISQITGNVLDRFIGTE